MEVKPIHIILGGAAIYLGYRALTKNRTSAASGTPSSGGVTLGRTAAATGPAPGPVGSSGTPSLAIDPSALSMAMAWGSAQQDKINAATDRLYSDLSTDQKVVTPLRPTLLAMRVLAEVFPAVAWPENEADLTPVASGFSLKPSWLAKLPPQQQDWAAKAWAYAVAAANDVYGYIPA